MLKKKDFIKIGRIQKPHGIKGEVILAFDSEIADEIEGQKTVFIEIDGGLVPFFISSFRYQNPKSAIVLFQLTRSEEEIHEIIGQNVFLNKINQPSLSIENDFDTEITGYVLYDAAGKRIGIITAFFDNPDNPLIEVKQEEKSNHQILVPFQEQLIIDFNPQTKSLTMVLPEGILDL